MTNHLLQPEVHVIITQAPGVDGAGTPAQLAQIEADLAEVLGRPNVARLNDLNDVNAPSPASGQVLMYSSNAWRPGTPTTAIEAVHETTVIRSDARIIKTAGGIAFSGSTDPGTVWLLIQYGGTGSSTSVARSDHNHNIRLNSGYTFGSSGILSSGTRTLVSETISGLDPNRTYVIAGDVRFDVRGQGTGAGRHTPAITIRGASQSRAIPVRTVAGVDRLSETTHDGVTVTGVSSVAVSATVSYTDGDPVLIAGGKLAISIKSNR